MIKLNNKGFAVSTILYGVLSLIIIILMLIFAIMKSSKDMNQELIKSVEEKLNKCVLDEVKLENCYYNGSSCNASEYNSCIGKKTESYLLKDKVRVGDFVDYDAGFWPTTEELPVDKNFTMGGYKAGSSRNNSVNCNSTDENKYNGWRVARIDGNNVILIHAGTPACYNQIKNSDYLKATADYHYLTGLGDVSNNAYIKENNVMAYNWSAYVDKDYAVTAIMSSYNDLAGGPSNIVIGAEYFTADLCSSLSCLMGFEKNQERNTSLYYGLRGVRPLVVLKDDVKTGCSITNTYGMTEWILVK